MIVNLLSFLHHKAIMGAKSCAHPTVKADNGLLRIPVEIDRANGASRHTFAATIAFFFYEQYAAARPQFQCIGRAYVPARGFFAAAAHSG